MKLVKENLDEGALHDRRIRSQSKQSPERVMSILDKYIDALTAASIRLINSDDDISSFDVVQYIDAKVQGTLHNG